MIDVAALTGVEGGFNPSRGVSGEKEPNLVARLILICKKAHISRPQTVGFNADGRIRADRWYLANLGSCS
jgi:hypothetical protein